MTDPNGAPPPPPPAGDPPPAAWYPDEHKEFVTTKGWKSPADVITSTMNLEKLLGADRAGRTVVLPKDETDVEGMKAFRAKLGVPDAPDAYELPLPDGDGGEFAKTAAQWFHEAGIPKAAGQKIAAQWNEHFSKMVEEQQAQAQASSRAELESLKSEWGKDFDKNSEYARRFLRAAGWDDAKMSKYEQAFGTAQMLKDFHAWGSKTAEAAFVGGEQQSGGLPAKLQIQSKMDELRAQRIEGRVGEKEYLERMEMLGAQLSAAA